MDIYAQSIDSLDNIQNIIEDKVFSEQEEDAYNIAEYLDELIDNSININTTDAAGLSYIPFLSPNEVEKIIAHRKTYGPFFSKAELYLVKGITENKIRDILQFITLNDNTSTGIFPHYKVSLRSRFKKNDLEDKNNYQWSSYNRFKLDLGSSINAGVLTEKDEGEKIITDLLTGYIRLNNVLYINNIFLGDFFLEQGQGLLFWSSYGMPKNADVISPGYKRGKGFIPNATRNEMAFFRGIAVENEFGNFILRGFYSGRNKDASTDSVNIIRLLKDGYHRTETEINRHNSVSEKTIGGNLIYKTQLFEAGLSGYAARFSKIILPGSYEARGFSLSTRFILDDFLFFGEGALTGNSKAVLIGGSISPGKGIEFITVFRRYEADYLNLYGYGFGEKSGITQNETGIYSGLSVENKFGSFGLYLDQYSFPNPGDNVHNSLNGTDVLFSASVPVNKKTVFNFRYKVENKDDIISYADIKINGKKHKENIRTEIIRKFNSLTLKLRGDYVSIFIRDLSNETGYMIMNEIKYTPLKEFSFIFRSAFFSTDSYQTALFIYEGGIPGIMENKGLYGNGFRFYSVLKLTIKNFPVFYLKYSDTIKSGSNITETSSLILQVEFKY
jgi:hypothetical protein